MGQVQNLPDLNLSTNIRRAFLQFPVMPTRPGQQKCRTKPCFKFGMLGVGSVVMLLMFPSTDPPSKTLQRK